MSLALVRYRLRSPPANILIRQNTRHGDQAPRSSAAATGPPTGSRSCAPKSVANGTVGQRCRDEAGGQGRNLEAIYGIAEPITGDWRTAAIALAVPTPSCLRLNSECGILTISSHQAQNLSLVLHELVTNAAKYGALSRTSGKVEITWVVSQLQQVVQLTWRERGGPSVASPRHAGFGTMLLKATYPNAQVDYAPEGLCCQVEILTAKNRNTSSIQRLFEANAT
jgi:hypothetical protein